MNREASKGSFPYPHHIRASRPDYAVMPRDFNPAISPDFLLASGNIPIDGHPVHLRVGDLYLGIPREANRTCLSI